MLDIEGIKRRRDKSKEDRDAELARPLWPWDDLGALVAEVERLRREREALMRCGNTLAEEVRELRAERAALPYMPYIMKEAGKAFLEKLAVELDDPEGVFLKGEGIGRPVGIMPPPLETRPDRHTDGYDEND